MCTLFWLLQKAVGLHRLLNIIIYIQQSIARTAKFEAKRSHFFHFRLVLRYMKNATKKELLKSARPYLPKLYRNKSGPDRAVCIP